MKDTLIAFAVLIGVFFTGFGVGTQMESNVWQKKWDANTIAVQAAQAARSAELEQLRKDYDAKIVANDAQHKKDVEKITDAKNKTIADWQSGRLRLRDKFTCPARAVPDSPAGVGGSQDGSNTGLSNEDVGFLVSESERANQRVATLNKCIRQLANDRLITGGK